MTSKTEALDYHITGILAENFTDKITEDCVYCNVSSRILKAFKDAGGMFVKKGVKGDDLEGACLCRVEEIEV